MDCCYVKVEIIEPCTLVPLDKKIIIDSIRKTNRVVIVQEACRRMGFGSELVRVIRQECFDFLDTSPLVLGLKRCLFLFVLFLKPSIS